MCCFSCVNKPNLSPLILNITHSLAPFCPPVINFSFHCFTTTHTFLHLTSPCLSRQFRISGAIITNSEGTKCSCSLSKSLGNSVKITVIFVNFYIKSSPNKIRSLLNLLNWISHYKRMDISD
jgi:hypothetical protein